MNGANVLNEVVYNIPINLFGGYKGRKVIVRSYEPEEIVALSGGDMENLIAVQLLSMNGNVDVLGNWGYGIPVDLVMLHPQSEFPSLYRHAKLQDRHPLRVCIPVVNGFSKAVKVAASLKLFIKLEIGQPDPSLIEEIHRVLNFYIHNPSVALPIEYFHSTFLAMHHSEQSSLWDIQEEDPAIIRYVTEDGKETIARRLGCGRTAGDPETFVAEFQNALFAERVECYECQYFKNCGGYFKWPNKAYPCDGIKTLFSTISNAAREMRDEIAVLIHTREGAA
jgi:hypothetical protein